MSDETATMSAMQRLAAICQPRSGSTPKVGLDTCCVQYYIGKAQEAAAGPRAAIAAQLEKSGALTAGNEELAMQIARQLREQFGFTRDQAGAAAATAVGAGMGTFDEAGLVAALQARGASFEGPQDVVNALNNLRESPEGDTLLRQLLAERAQAASAQRERAAGQLDKESGATTPIQSLFRVLQERGELPPGVENADQLAGKLAMPPAPAGNLFGFVLQKLAKGPDEWLKPNLESIAGEWSAAHELRNRVSVLEQQLQQLQGLERSGAASPSAPPGEATGPLGTLKQRAQVVNVVTRIGTMHVNGANAKRRPRHPTLSPSGIDDSFGAP